MTRSTAPIPHQPDRDSHGLSYSQKGAWLREQLFPGHLAYNTVRVLDLAGPLDTGRLRAALQALVDRYDVLRARFVRRGSEPVQRFGPLEVELPLADLSVVPPGEQPAEARRRLREALEVPFDLERGPLCRFQLVRFAPSRHLLVLGIHHIVVDGASYRQIVGEVLASYQGNPLPPPRLQFQDFAAWQRDRVESGELAESHRYWMERLGGELPVLDLPTDRPRPAVPSYAGASVSLALGPDLKQVLKGLARDRSTTLFRLFCAAFKVFLHRLTGATDIVVGAPFSGRTHPDLESQIGFFVTTPALRTDLGGDPSFEEALARVDETVSGAKAHQDYPFDKLLEHLSAGRDLSRSPVYSAAVLQRPLTAPRRAGDLLVGHWEHVPDIAPYELMVTEAETEAGIQVLFNYRPELFDRTTVARWAASFEELLRGLAADPRRSISELPLLRPAELHLVLREWNAAPAPRPSSGEILPSLFERQVERDPEAVAVVDGETRLSYGELNRRANRLAHRLRALGVGPESIVALRLERSSRLVWAILGVLKAGGAYLPLDPAYPEGRLAAMLDDARPAVLLSDGPVPDALVREGLAVVELAEGPPDEEPVENPPAWADPESLAYVIYTSGSTGRPKGTPVCHRNVTRLFHATEPWFGFGREDVWTLFHSAAFDFSVWELWGALLYGGRLVIVPFWLSRSPEELYALLAHEGVTVLNQTPSAFRELATRSAAAEPGLALRLVIFGGEALDLPSVGAWLGRHGDGRPRLVNMYGITETTVHVTYRRLGRADLAAPWRRPIGIALPDLEVYLLDRRGQPVPMGASGELLVGGEGLARGYLGRPELTAERFVPHPWATRPGERLYRSGDLARWLPDGQLDYLGRIDHQVKVRGFRIELGEIEAALAGHPAVRAAVVLARRDPAGGQRLVAFVVAGEGASPADLSRHLGERLPAYMVPAFIVPLDSLPLTRNGKVDRAALERRDPVVVAGARREITPPRDPVEAQLARIWEDVLRVEPVGVDDDFFELGGHSLLATRVAARVREVFGRELSVRALFEAPTVAQLARLLEATLAAAPPPIRPVDRRGALPLSFAQQRLWFLDQLAPVRALYNIPAAWSLSGPLDVPALARSLAAVVRRHEVLRTRFPSEADRPVQEILRAARLDMPVADLSALAPERGRAELRRLSPEDAAHPFELARGPLLRAILVRLAAEESALLLTLHHIVADGWSLGVLLHDLAAFYEADVRAEAAALPELPVQYADFAVWQREWLQGAVLDELLGYWRRQLAGAAILELPTDRPRPAVQAFRGGHLSFSLPEERLLELQTLSRRRGATLYMTLLAAFLTLLHRLTGQTDVAVGAPIANRNHPGIEGLIGFFVNTLVLRGDLAGDPRFDELLDRVLETALAAYIHQDLPFEKLVEQIQPERDLSRNPVVQVVVAMQNAPRAAAAMAGVAVEPLPVDARTTRFDLEVYFKESPAGLQGVLVYDLDLFDADRIARLVAQFQILLAGAAANPETHLSLLPLLAESERRELLEWAGRPAARPWRPVHELFEAQVERTPAAVAVESAGRRLTYAELNRRANQLARHLARRGVGPETLVGLFVERSVEMVVALLGILKAGGAYLPLELTQGEERLRFQLADGGVRVVVTRAELAPQLPGAGTLEVVCLDRDAPRIDRESAVNPASGAGPDNLAYVIYTSGSTGRPKGSEIPHRAIPGFLSGIDYVDFTGSQVFLQYASISWDVLTLELWPCLLHGGRCALVAERLLTGEDLGKAISRHGVTILWLTASLFNAVVDTRPEALAGLDQLMVGGEALSVPHVRRALELFPGLRLVNGYGPSECTVFAACHPVVLPFREGETSIPIGRPIGDRRIYLLDRHLQLVPRGIAGELCVAGDSLARGYLHRPELTAERFVPDPITGAPGGRLYRTGDLVRWSESGLLEFLGRIDQQVKVRGFRVEPGEIEAVLAEHPDVSEAAVLALPDPAGGTRLVAYVVPAAAPRRELEEALRGHLGERLPAYMVPASFVTLQKMPLNANGKLDRRALPLLDTEAEEEVFTAPRDPVEARLAALWQELLGVERVGIDDDFFALGGHSILATRVVSRIRRDFGVELPLLALFEAPNVAGLARRIETASASERPPIVPVPRGGELPLSFAQQRLWFFDRLLPQSALYNIAVAWRLAGTLHVPALRAALEEIARRHEALRTSFPARDGRPVQHIGSGADLPLPVIDLTTPEKDAQQGELRRLAREEAARPFDLGRGPVLRVRLLRLAPAEHALFLTVHHIAFDGWSSGVFRRELTSLYNAFSRGGPSLLPELPVQYADFSCWQRQWLSGETLEEQLAFWRERLSGSPPPLELPGDRPRPPVPSFRGAAEEIALHSGLVESLSRLGHGRGATLFMTLLAGFAALLHRWTGADEVLVGSPIANRHQSEIEPLIGFFANTLALRTELSGDPRFIDLLRQVSETCLGASMHQDIPFERLVEELQPERDLSRQPLFQVMLQWQNAPAEPFGLEGLTLDLLPPVLERSAFDLIAILTETPAAGVSGHVLYSTDLFDRTTVARFTEHFRLVLAGAAESPGRRLSELPLLSPGQRQQLLLEWNDTRAVFAADRCVHELFAEQAARAPESVAAVFADQRLSYRALEERANQLAWHLRRRGVGPEVLVGLCLPRSLDLLVALLGILKAGGAYLPLDPDYPRERLASMIEDARVPLLVSRRELVERLLPASPARLVCLAGDAEAMARESTAAPPSGVTPDNLAYAIYTSGSTGRPKAVLVPHRGLGSLAEAQVATFGLGPGDRLLQFSSPSFDAATFELVLALRAGSTLWMGTRQELLPGAELVRLLRTREVTAMLLPPSALAAVPAGELPALRMVLTAGEACSAGLVDRWASGRRFFNLYGPTEATIWTTSWRAASDGRKPTLGRPIPNVEVYLLDRHLDPVPVGVPGELYIGGVGVARGYLSRPGLTAERFIPHPFHGEPGHRLYRTGDLARFREDGELEFLGRTDHQVKIRGFRIETGEVETVLGEHPDVAEAAVLALPDPAGGRRLVAYVVPAARRPDLAEVLRGHLGERLPAYMVPAAFVILEQMPFDANGKLDRRALPVPEALATPLQTTATAPRNAAEQTIAGIWRDLLGREQVGIHDNFFDLGGHSLLLVRLQAALREAFGREIPIVDLFQYPTVGTLAELLSAPDSRAAGEPGVERAPRRLPASAPPASAVAVIGLAGRFPGAACVEDFWRNVSDGVESIRFFSDEEVEVSDPAWPGDPHHVKAGGFLDGADLFDAGFFGMTPREAEILDPQQRLFLETAWEALEDAGYVPRTFPGLIGVYAGVQRSSYWTRNLSSHPELLEAVGRFQALMANEKDFLVTRVAYKLGLRGPAIAVQTACSTSLVAIHQACQSLRVGDCDLALAGGVAVSFPQKAGYLYQEGGILAPDGHCRAFDARARGSVSGSGVGVVVLKRFPEALADGDAIRAVIKGSAVNNDGSLKVGFTAPSVVAQAEVIARAQARAGVEPGSIGLVEAHGSGTELGDPIEVAALKRAFGPGTGPGSCALGSVKTNIGHLDAAAGVAGFIKAALAVERGMLPPSLHFEEPNPKIDFASGPFYVNTRLAGWPPEKTPRRAGVSSFGLGGTNAHVVLESAPPPAPAAPGRPWQLLVLSARSDSALAAARSRLAELFRRHPQTTSLADAAFTLQVGRQAHGRRLALVCRTLDEAVAALGSPEAKTVLTGSREPRPRPVAFLFPGQGVHYVDMGRELYRDEPVFREEIDRAAEILGPSLGLDLRRVLYPGLLDGGSSGEEAERLLAQTAVAQTALVAFEIALARLWTSWGVVPHAMIGHSIGEFAAATVAGVFTLEDVLPLVADRGRMMQRLGTGAMLAVPLPEEEILPLLGEELSLASISSPSLCVVSGAAEAVAALEHRLAGSDVPCMRLNVGPAGHSRQMEPLLGPFAAAVGRVRRNPPQIPFLSGVTGDWIQAGEAMDPGYWARHLRQTARFAPGLKRLLSEPGQVLLEVGPGQNLSSIALQQLEPGAGQTALSSLRHPQELGPLRRARQEVPSAGAHLLTSLGRLWLAGVEVDWAGLHARERRRRIPLPTYPFERQRFWIAPAGARAPRAAAGEPPRPSGPPPVAAAGVLAPGDGLAGILGRQLQLMSRQLQVTSEQLALLRGSSPELAPAAAGERETAPLSPIQRWFFGRGFVAPHRFTMARLFEVAPELPPGLLEEALAHVAARHDALWLRFGRNGAGWGQRHDGAARPALLCCDLSALPPARRALALEDAGAALHESLDVSRGPLLRAAFFHCGPGAPGRLLLVIHHLAVDITSWRILAEDLESACADLARGRPVRLPEVPTSFLEWARRLESFSRSQELSRQLGFWLAGPRERAPRLPVDHPGANTVASARTVVVSLSGDETRRLLREITRTCRALPSEAALAAVAEALAGWMGKRTLLIDLEAHGREDLFADVDLSRTVGWLTSPFPLLLELEGAGSPREVLRAVKDQARRVPDGGIGYGLLRHASPDPAAAARLGSLPQAEVVFNYLGHHPVATEAGRPAGVLLRPARESAGAGQDPREIRFHLLDADAYLAGGSLHLQWRYSERLHRRITIEDLAHRALDVLRGLAAGEGPRRIEPASAGDAAGEVRDVIAEVPDASGKERPHHV